MDNMYNMIQQGEFGTTGPIYNPYMNQPNNMVAFGAGYSPQAQMYYGQPIQTPQGVQYGNPYAQPQQQQSSYYNPYGNLYGNQPFNSNNPYGFTYNNYPQYGNYYQQAMEYANAQQKQALEMEKLKLRMRNKYFGIEMSEDEIDKALNPNNPTNQPTREELETRREFNMVQQMYNAANNPNPPLTRGEMAYNAWAQQSEEMHEDLDTHSMCEFFENDFWKIKKKMWEEEHLLPKDATRDMRGTYDSDQYNQLLNLHNSSNPYVNQLLDNARYDNNVDDYAIGMNAVMDRERRRQNILNGDVPEFVSSPEAQKARSEWTQSILNQIYNKEVK